VNLIVRRINRSDRRTSGFPLAINVRTNVGGAQTDLLQELQVGIIGTHFIFLFPCNPDEVTCV